MAKLTKQANAAVVTYPGKELADNTIRSLCRRLVREQGWRYSWAGGAGYPQLINPEGTRTYVPKTPSSSSHFERKVRRLGAVLDNDQAASRRSSFDGESLHSDTTETPWTEAEWRERQRSHPDAWRRGLYAEPLPEPEPAPPPAEPTPQQRELMARLARGTEVKDDARGDKGFTLADARRMLKDGYSLAHTVNTTGWGRMWLADLAERLDNG